MNRIATFYDHIKDMAKEENLSMLEAMHLAKELGIGALEISQSNILGREHEVAAELKETGLGITTVPSYFNFGEDDDVTAQALPTLEAAQLLGAKKMLVIPGFVADDADAATRERATVRMIENINRLGELAERYGVTLVIESYDNPGAVFTRSSEIQRFVTECPKLFTCFDTGNFRMHNEDELQAYETLRDTIEHVHLKDREFAPIFGQSGPIADDGQQLFPAPVGAGKLKIAEIVDRLEQSGYTGFYVLEHYGVSSMLAGLKQSVQWLQPRINS